MAVYHSNRSLWWERSAPYVPSEPLRSEIEVDVCVIGGGITGLSTALHLRKADPSVSVALLEAGEIGFGASGRNAGQLLVQFGGDWGPNLKRHGAEKMGVALNYVYQGIQLIERLQSEEGIEFDYANTGTLKVGLGVDGSGPIEAYRSFLDQAGQSSYLTDLNASQVQEEIQSPYLGQAFFDPRGGTNDPLKLLRGLRLAIERRGCQVFEHSPVAQVLRRQGHILVQTGMGAVRCQKLVLATNGYTHLIEGGLEFGVRRRQRPLLVKATATAPLTPEQWTAAGWRRRCGINVVSDLFFSFAPTADGRVVTVGGYYTSSPGDRALAPEVEWRLKAENREHLGAFFPALRDIDTAQTWGGPISLTRDIVPHVGQAEDPRILYACGCWGNGVPLGARNGVTLADLALERSTESTDLWFVRRAKENWPSGISTLVTSQAIAERRRRARAIGGKMSPPLTFAS